MLPVCWMAVSRSISTNLGTPTSPPFSWHGFTEPHKETCNLQFHAGEWQSQYPPFLLPAHRSFLNHFYTPRFTYCFKTKKIKATIVFFIYIKKTQRRRVTLYQRDINSVIPFLILFLALKSTTRIEKPIVLMHTFLKH